MSFRDSAWYLSVTDLHEIWCWLRRGCPWPKPPKLSVEGMEQRGSVTGPRLQARAFRRPQPKACQKTRILNRLPLYFGAELLVHPRKHSRLPHLSRGDCPAGSSNATPFLRFPDFACHCNARCKRAEGAGVRPRSSFLLCCVICVSQLAILHSGPAIFQPPFRHSVISLVSERLRFLFLTAFSTLAVWNPS